MGAATLYLSLDRNQMEQALLNILKNAVEAIDRDGLIQVHLEDGPRPTILIEDSGNGIAPDMEDTLFSPFYTTKKGGQGIGLTLVQEILNGHGYEYALENTGQGTTRFSIWAPRQMP